MTTTTTTTDLSAYSYSYAVCHNTPMTGLSMAAASDADTLAAGLEQAERMGFDPANIYLDHRLWSQHTSEQQQAYGRPVDQVTRTTGKAWTMHHGGGTSYSQTLAVLEAKSGGFYVVWESGSGWNDRWLNLCRPVDRDTAAAEWRKAQVKGFKVDETPRYRNVERDCGRVSLRRW